LQHLEFAIPGGALKQFHHGFTQDFSGDGWIGNPIALHSRTQFPDELFADIDPHIRLEQEHFEVFVQLFIDGAAIEQAGDLAEDPATRFFE
jgi:hypothetical protein